MNYDLVYEYKDLADAEDTTVGVFEWLINKNCIVLDKFQNVRYNYDNFIRSRIYFNKSSTEEMMRCIDSICFICGNNLNAYIVFRELD